MTHALLPNQVAHMIVELIEQDDLAEGERLPERALAARLRVSRTPVRQALKLLEESGFVNSVPLGGYAVSNRGAAPEKVPESEQDAYFRIARDRVSGELPDRVAENELMRRYNLSRGQLSRLLRRTSAEGWLQRLPGRGWAFAQTLTSGESFKQCQYFRLQIEPSALLQPTFELDRPLLERCRARQIELLNNGEPQASPVELFETNAEFHESLVACARNPFFLDALKRINTLRRLVAYQRMVSRPVRTSLIGEHLHILDLLLTGDRAGAAEALERHLQQALERTFD